MAQDFLLDFVNYFVGQNILLGDGIDAFRDQAPTTPDDCMYAFEYNGKPSGVGNFGTRFVQFNCRSKSYKTARNMCMQMFRLFGLDEEDNRIQLTTDRWVLVVCLNSPFKSAVDDQGRTVFTFNVRVLTYYE